MSAGKLRLMLPFRLNDSSWFCVMRITGAGITPESILSSS